MLLHWVPRVLIKHDKRIVIPDLCQKGVFPLTWPKEIGRNWIFFSYWIEGKSGTGSNCSCFFFKAHFKEHFGFNVCFCCMYAVSNLHKILKKNVKIYARVGRVSGNRPIFWHLTSVCMCKRMAYLWLKLTKQLSKSGPVMVGPYSCLIGYFGNLHV